MNFKEIKEAILFANEYLVSGFFNQMTLTATPIKSQGNETGQSVDIVSYLYDWSLSPMDDCSSEFNNTDFNHEPLNQFNEQLNHQLSKAQRTRLFYLLGDFGSGKSGVCKELIGKLYQTYEENRFTDTMAKPTLPVYFNLGLLTGIYGELEFANKSLAELIEVMFCVTGVPKVAGDDIIKLVRQYPCLVVFDGFDEAVQKLSKNQQNGFLNKLLSILPSMQYSKDLMRMLGKPVEESTIPDSPSRLVLSCRTQLFESTQEQTAFMEAFYHTEMSINGMLNYQAYQLDALSMASVQKSIKRDIAFINKQARNQYNKDKQNKDEQDELKQLNTSHPDCQAFLEYLVDLSISPLLLALAKSLIPSIQPSLDKTGTINSAEMFTDLISKVMQRDRVKSTINIKEKQQILGAIAIKLWQDRTSHISLENLRTYFFTHYREHRQLQLGIDTGRVELEIAMQDLHNAMLVRNQHDMYAFYHPLIGNYFLAVGLFEVVRQARQPDDLKHIADAIFQTDKHTKTLMDTLNIDGLIFVSQMVASLIIRGDMHSYDHVYHQWLSLCQLVANINQLDKQKNESAQQKALEMWTVVMGDDVPDSLEL